MSTAACLPPAEPQSQIAIVRFTKSTKWTRRSGSNFSYRFRPSISFDFEPFAVVLAKESFP
jgi:hypothetical protein